MSHPHWRQVQVLRACAAKQSPVKAANFSDTLSLFKRRLLARTVARSRRRQLRSARTGVARRAGRFAGSVLCQCRRLGLDETSRPAAARNDILVLFFLFLTSCASPTPLATPQVVTVYSTSAAQPWLAPLYACAGASTVISRVDDSSSADIILRLGEPDVLASPTFQIDTEEILIVTHRQSPIQNLTLEEARALFAGQGDPSVQVWVYASGEDVQKVFDQFVMAGRSVTPSARLAVNPQQMSDTLVNEPNTVGIVPRHWKAGDPREVFSVATVPVLVITNSQPQGVVEELLVCLQK